MIRTALALWGLGICCICTSQSLMAAIPYEQEWARRFGDPRNFKEHASAVAVDSADNAVVVGVTQGPRDPVNRGLDVYLRKTDTDGREVWTREIGGPFSEAGQAIAIGAEEEIFFTGSRESNMLLSKVSVDGDVEWLHQFGQQGDYVGTSLAINDFGEIIVTGNTRGNLSGENFDSSDAFLSKFDPNGQLVWRTQFGSTGPERAYGVDVDADGNAYAVGHINTGFDVPGAGGAFVSKFSDDGEMLWMRRIGSMQASAYATSVSDTGELYVVGNTFGGFGLPTGGGADAFIAKLSDDGDMLWANQFATPFNDFAQALALREDAVFLGGFTHGPTNFSNTAQSLIVKYDLDGTEQWRNVFGPLNADQVTGLAVGSRGDLFASGKLSTGTFDGTLLKFENPIPEPTAASMALITLAILNVKFGRVRGLNERTN